MIYVISGKKRTGKDTVAKFIQETYNDVQCEALAFGIKRTLRVAMQRYGYDKPYIRSLVEGKYSDPDAIFYEGDREKPLVMSNEDVLNIFRIGLEILKERGYNIVYHPDDIRNLIMSNDTPWSIRRLMQVFGTDIVCKYDNTVWVRYTLERFVNKYAGDEYNHLLVTDCRQEHEYKYLKRLGAKFVFIVKDTGIVDEHSTEKGLTPQPGDSIITNEGTLKQLKSKVLDTFKF